MRAECSGLASPAAEGRWLEALRRRYHRRRFVSPDPLEVLYDYDDVRDREIVGLIASALAYGNVKAMLPAIRSVLETLSLFPAAMLRSARPATLRRDLRGFRYRFTTGDQLAGLLGAIRSIITEHGSLEACFCAQLDDDDETILPALGAFVDALTGAADCSLAHLVPHPADGSACKRLNLFLRWMVRRDAIDPGGWERIGRARLIMPLDTHIYRIALSRGWTRRRTADLKAAVQITARLRRLCPADPLRWDFALTRPGIRGEG
jgi:uncharacterized protein (TIGR02757 family)